MYEFSGWVLRQTDPATYRVELGGEWVTTIRYDGRGRGSWGFYTEAMGYEYHSTPAQAFEALQDRHEGKS